MRLTQFAAAAVGSAVALVGFAGAANASATVDLIWIDTTDAACTDADRRDCPQLGPEINSVAVSDNITLLVLVTAGPGGLLGGGVSVDYGDYWSGSVVQFRSFTTPTLLPQNLGTTTHQAPFIDNINSTAAPFIGNGIGLPAGQSAYLGTVSFHNFYPLAGDVAYEIAVGTDGPGDTDGVGRLSDYADISDTTTFNSAYLSGDDFSGPGCTSPDNHLLMVIEVKALRATGKTIVTGPNDTTKVTSKARILKGTALSGTTIDTALTITAMTGGEVIDQQVAPQQITLEVGKGGKGDTLLLSTETCVGGYIAFIAEFRGLDVDGDTCVGTRELRKACR